MMERAQKNVPWLVVVYVVLILARLYLASRDEIIPYVADSAYYAASILHDAWFQEQRSGVAWLAWAVREFGIPYKLALDAAYVALCLAASRRIARGSGSELLALLVFFLLAFGSYFLRASLTFVSEPPTACLLLAATLVFSRFIERPLTQWRWADAIQGGIIFSLWSLMRAEEMIILCGMVALGTLIFLVHRYHWRSGWNRRGLLFLLPLLILAASDETVRVHNEISHHMAVQSRTFGPGELALLKALYSIPPDRELRYCPVTRATFQAAAQVSPTLKPLLSGLTDQQNRYYVYASQRYQIPGEVCTWVNFLLLDVYGRVYSVEDGSAERAMMRTAQEIRAAQTRGELGRRFAVYPVDPLWKLWLPDLPKTLAWGAWNSLALHYDIRSLADEEAQRADVLPLTDERNFADGLLLRTSLNDREQLDVSGVIETAGMQSAATSVLVRTDAGVVGASPVYPFTNLGHLARFNIVMHYPEKPSQLKLEFWDQGSLVQDAMLNVPGVQVLRVGAQAEPWTVVVRLDSHRPALPKRIEAALLKMNDLILGWGLATCIGLAACRAFGGSNAGWFSLVALPAVVVCFVVPRFVFYSLLHVWMHWDSLRYFSANGPATLLGLLTACVLAGIWIGRRIRQSLGTQE